MVLNLSGDVGCLAEHVIKYNSYVADKSYSPTDKGIVDKAIILR